MGEIVRNAFFHPSRVYDPLLGRSTSAGSRNPADVEVFREEIYRYYVRLLLPMCVLALRRPMLLLIGVPMLVINVLTTRLPGTHDARFHYSSLILVAIVLATIEGCRAVGDRPARAVSGEVATACVFGFIAASFLGGITRIPHNAIERWGSSDVSWLDANLTRSTAGWLLLGAVGVAAGIFTFRARAEHRRFRERCPAIAVAAVLGFALFTNATWSPSPLNDQTHHSGVWARPWLQDAPSSTQARDHMLDLVPSDAGLSATYGLIPHLTHREVAYEFPNPWWITNWLDCKTAPQPDLVDVLVVDRSVLGAAVNPDFGLSPQGLFDELTDPVDGEFAIIGEEGGIVVAERVRPAELSFRTPRPRCE
jgi:hypothetical protein